MRNKAANIVKERKTGEAWVATSLANIHPSSNYAQFPWRSPFRPAFVPPASYAGWSALRESAAGPLLPLAKQRKLRRFPSKSLGQQPHSKLTQSNKAIPDSLAAAAA